MVLIKGIVSMITGIDLLRERKPIDHYKIKPVMITPNVIRATSDDLRAVISSKGE